MSIEYPTEVAQEKAQQRRDVRDALRLMVAAHDAGVVFAEDADFADLFDRGLLRLHRDDADEYHTVLTDAGREFVTVAVAMSREQVERIAGLGTCSRCDDHNYPCICRSACRCPEGHRMSRKESSRA